MIERGVGGRSQLIIWAIWAAGEARRRRREAAPLEETLIVPGARPDVEGPVTADGSGVVVDWQLFTQAQT
jgi:hypothetical protein